jgi:hypothetical protein
MSSGTLEFPAGSLGALFMVERYGSPTLERCDEAQARHEDRLTDGSKRQRNCL